MKYLTIDWGSYSCKIMTGTLDRKQLVQKRLDEIIYPQLAFTRANTEAASSAAIPPIPAPEAAHEAKTSGPLTPEQEKEVLANQLKLISQYVARELEEEDRLILFIPNEWYSFRPKVLPVNTLKKAMAMVQYELEEDLPFASQDLALFTALRKRDRSSFESINFFNKKKYQEEYDQLLEKSGIYPQQLLHPAGLFYYLPLLTQHPIKQESACYMDLGHQYTKCYFYHQGQCISYHLSHFAGARIDDMLKNLYRLEHEAMIKFKHESAFILPKPLISEKKLTPDQIFFAENMDLLFSNLLQDFRLWEMSYRVQTKKPIQKIYLAGGSAQLKNLDQYLSYNLGIEVVPMQDNDQQTLFLASNAPNYSSYATTDLLSKAHLKLNLFPNLLSQKNRLTHQDAIPYANLLFTMTRSLALCSLILFFGLLLSVFQLQQRKKIEVVLRQKLQQPALDLSAADKLLLAVNPEILQKKLADRQRQQQKDLKKIQDFLGSPSMPGIREIQPLLAASANCYLESWKGQGVMNGRIGGCESEALSSLKQKMTQLKEIKIISLKDKQLEFSWSSQTPSQASNPTGQSKSKGSL